MSIFDRLKDWVLDKFNKRFDKEAVFYTTYGYQTDGGDWVIPMRVWVRRRRPYVLDDFARLWPGEQAGLSDDEIERLGVCSEDFIADDCGEDRVSFSFDGEPGRTYQFSAPTNTNGLAEEKRFSLDAGAAERLLEKAGSRWLSLTIKADGKLGDAEGRGRVVLLPQTGLSVVSDVDDTIKVTEILEGLDRVARRTFLMDFEPVAGMRDRYDNILRERAEFDNISFHYVSGSPWPLYRLLQKFLVEEQRFPEGTFHLKGFSKSLRDRASFVRDLRGYVEGKMNTEDMKVEIISELMNNLPDRKFVLYGDSGENDPEAFRRVKRADARGQVVAIFIRDVKGEGRDSPRLDGMESIPV